jgi:hypothetical protein
MINRWKDDSNKGLFAYTRTLGDQDALVVLNTDWSTKTLSPVVGKPDGTVYVNLLNPTETMTVSGGKLNNISVASKGSKIFFAGTSKSDVQTVCSRTAVTITYKPNKGPLENAVSNIVLSIRNDGAVDAVDMIMTKNGDAPTPMCTRCRTPPTASPSGSAISRSPRSTTPTAVRTGPW